MRPRLVLIDILAGALVLLVTLWLYVPTLSIPLWEDDSWHIYELRNPLRAIRLLYDSAVALDVNWVWFRPLGDLSYTLDFQLWGLNPRGYHAHSLLLHCLVVAMLVWFLREWLNEGPESPRKDSTTVWLIAIAFTVNPITAQTVSRPSNRYDLYATLLVLIALLALRRWRRGAGPVWHALALGAAFGAFASKDSAVVLLPLVFLFSPGGLPARFRAVWPFAAVALLYGAWRLLVVQGIGGYVWLDWSWHDLFNPANYFKMATAMGRAAWGSPWPLGALLVGVLASPKSGSLTSLAFFASLAPVIPLRSLGSADLRWYVYYLPLVIFFIGLGTTMTALERWKGGRVVSLFCLLALTWQGFQGIQPTLTVEARLGEPTRVAATSLARLSPPLAGVSDYFLSEGAFYVRIMTALITGTSWENWRVLEPNTALLSHGLVAKVEAGAARIFRYDGAVWKDTTTDTVTAIRDGLAKRMAPAPTLNVTTHGYRVTVRIAAGTTHRGPFKLYFNRSAESGIYEGFIWILTPVARFSVPRGSYTLTATYETPKGESLPAAEVRLRVPGDA
jgi:hypothetical protein